MKCREASNWLLSTLQPTPLLPGLGRHLRVCGKCRRLHRRLRRLSQVAANAPLPLDNPQARARMLAQLPALPVRAAPTGLMRLMRAAVIFILATSFASVIVAVLSNTGPTGDLAERRNEQKKAPVREANGTPEELMVVRFLDRDLRLAETFTPEEQVPVLAAMASDLREEATRMARAGLLDDLPLLAALYQRLTRGLVSRAWQVAPDRMAEVLGPVVAKLRETAAAVKAASEEAPAAALRALEPIGRTAQDAASLLAALPAKAEPVWREPLDPMPQARSNARTLLTTLVQQGLRLTEEDDPLLRVEYCQDVANGLLRVIMLDTIKGDTDSASRLGQPLGQFMDRSVKAQINQLPVNDPRTARLQEVLTGAARIIQDLEGTLLHSPSNKGQSKDRFKELEKMVKEMKKLAESLEHQGKGKGKKDDHHDKGKGKGKGKKDDPKAKNMPVSQAGYLSSFRRPLPEMHAALHGRFAWRHIEPLGPC